jgi:hypothetical protein
MASILFTMADVEMAQFAKMPFRDIVGPINPNKPRLRVPRPKLKPKPNTAISPKPNVDLNLRKGDPLKKLGKAGDTFLRRTKRGGLAVVKKGIRAIARNPGKTAAIAGGLAAAGAAGAYLLGRGGRSRREENYSRQIRTVYFSRRYN